MINDKDINISEKPIAEEKAQASQEPPKQETPQQESQQQEAPFVFVGVLFKQKLFENVAALGAPTEPVGAATNNSIDQIGSFLLSTDAGGYLLPFEAVSVLLLACIVAGLLIARKR